MSSCRFVLINLLLALYAHSAVAEIIFIKKTPAASSLSSKQAASQQSTIDKPDSHTAMKVYLDENGNITSKIPEPAPIINHSQTTQSPSYQSPSSKNQALSSTSSPQPARNSSSGLIFKLDKNQYAKQIINAKGELICTTHPDHPQPHAH